MTLASFQDFVRGNWNRRRLAEASSTTPEYKMLRDLFIMSQGLAGESGEVAELLKKHVRDGALDKAKLAFELGDVLHYLTKIAQTFDFTLEQVMDANMLKLSMRHEDGKNEERELAVLRGMLASRARYDHHAHPLEPTRREVPAQPMPYQFDLSDTFDHDRSCPGD